ncbi:hypothetical protein KC19_VG234000 [Ceratodon purpureus]|uniref:Uncharacterized protein n=1 Tax=Ceratodon purpureus TaxID=3225 RepID=A0A8T0HTN6_CERPU|nr:hypothetical protein KC19_VG234000 [Ceratodon purpureus]
MQRNLTLNAKPKVLVQSPPSRNPQTQAHGINPKEHTQNPKPPKPHHTLNNIKNFLSNTTPCSVSLHSYTPHIHRKTSLRIQQRAFKDPQRLPKDSEITHLKLNGAQSIETQNC